MTQRRSVTVIVKCAILQIKARSDQSDTLWEGHSADSVTDRINSGGGKRNLHDRRSLFWVQEKFQRDIRED
ncbi:hypothetical protein SRHO_G00058130 [Serrasalmus rhombeus]